MGPQFKPPITLKELHAIGERNRYSKDVKALLWEIKRLHAHVLRADQLARSIPESKGAVGMILEALRNEIKDEPCILEHRKRWSEIHAGPGDDD
jgi:hypothetical protein